MAVLFRKERKARKITQVELSAKLRISQGQLSKLEAGLSIPDSVLWLEFCSLFGLQADLPLSAQRFNAHIGAESQKSANKASKKVQAKARY